MIGSRSYLFEYKFNKTTGKQISAGAGPGGSALTVSQSRAQLSMWSILKSPLLASADLELVSTWAADPTAQGKGSGLELIEVLKNEEVLAVSDDPLGQEAVRLEDFPGGGIKSSPDVFVGAMVGGKYAVAFLNRAGGPTNMTLALQDLAKVPVVSGVVESVGQEEAGVVSKYAVRDLWAHSDNGTVGSSDVITTLVGKLDVVMLTLTPTV
jgi:alpha-galactosidase